MNRLPNDGIQREDLERLLQPGAHDYPPSIKFPTIQKLEVIVDCKDQEVLLEKGTESVLVRACEINSLVAKLLKAKDLFGESNGK